MPTLTTVRWISDGEVITSILLNRPLSDLDTNIETLNSWADALINDSTTSTTKVWSSSKVASEIDTAVTAGAGSGSDADRLDGQHGAFYQNATNINDGTIGSSFLPDASTTAIGAVEKATTTEAQNGTAGVFPDAAGVKAHLDNRVTQSNVDTTVDRLLKVGDAGILGNAVHATSGSANDFVNGVTYIAVGNVVTDLPSTNAIAYLVWNSGNTSVTSAVVQIAIDMVTGVEYTRIGTGSWSFKYSTTNNTNLVKKDVVGEVMDAPSNTTHNLTIQNGGGSAKVLNLFGGTNNDAAVELLKAQSFDGSVTPFAVYGDRITSFGKTLHSYNDTETVTDVLTSFTTASTDHYVIGELSSPLGTGRGGFEFKVITTGSGGFDTPQTTTITGFKDWINTGVINISGGHTVYGAAIILGTDNKYYVTIQFSESIEAGEVVTRTGTRNVFSPVIGALPTRASKSETSVIAEAKYTPSLGSSLVGLNTSGGIVGSNLASVSSSPIFVLQDTDGTGAQQTGYLSFRDSNDVEQAWLGFGTTGNSDFNIQNSYGTLTFNGGAVWHADNDGSGSGLDADMVDGIQGVNIIRGDIFNTTTITGKGFIGTEPSAATSSDYRPTHTLAPEGAVFSSAVPNNTGFIKISFPNTWTDTMFRLRMKVYNYGVNRSFTVDLGGYAYSASTWINTTAFISGNNSNYTVRFGHDGTNICIYIGESNSVWDYPSVVIEDVVVSFNNFQYTNWNDGWDISITPSVGTITSTHTNTQLNKYVDGNEIYHAGNLTPSEIQTTDITVTVGSGGDYSTINAALEALSKKAPQYKSSGVRATINLLSGFVMAEQVVCDGIDLSWITIVGEDASTTITGSAVTVDYSNSSEYPAAFTGVNNASIPTISQLFTYSGGSNKTGLVLDTASRGVVTSGNGVTNASRGCFIAQSAVLSAKGSNFTGVSWSFYCNGGEIYASSSVTGTPSLSGFSVGNGGIIRAPATTGSTNITTNTVTSSGIIFK